MLPARRDLAATIALAGLLLIVANSVTVTSQATDELPPRFSGVLTIIHQAEASGATPDELKEIVVQLNSALELNDESLRLTGPADADRRTQVLTQLDQMLTSLETKASGLEAVASQRAFRNRLLAYGSGGVGALLVTVGYAYGSTFWHRYRIKRTFQMRIHPK